jgi:bis(5'-nucleosyl)-tetraphosphatase (symmetrical)
MAVYAIGDVQGCYQELLELLALIDFDERRDRLWFTGDLVNRGPASLSTLRFVRALGERAVTVLGNHDLHLLAVATGARPVHRRDTFQDVLAAPDRQVLLNWLTNLPLLHHDPRLNFTLVHAGLYPCWTLALAQRLAREAEAVLRGEDQHTFLHAMYGNLPPVWSDDLKGHNRVRFVINCFTRMRYLNGQGHLDFEENGPPGTQAKGLLPWYKVTNRADGGLRLVFGHWSTATLGDPISEPVYPLDTGCVWGGSLTAMRLGKEVAYFRVPCPGTVTPQNLPR